MYALIVVILSILALWFYRSIRSYLRKKILIDQFPGPKTYPIIGNCLELQHETTADYFTHMKSYCKVFNAKIVRIWMFTHAFLFIYGVKEAEAIFSSTKNIQKGRQYNLLHPWLKMGLLTSFGGKWRGRRKLLTPTFHYDILKDFLVVFNKQAEILVNILSKQTELCPRVNVSNFLTLCTLDIIIETAMGQNINSQENGHSDYVTAVHKATEIVFDATRKPWCWNKRLFQLIGRGKEFQECLYILLTYSRKIIEDKWKKLSEKNAHFDQDSSSLQKRRLAFLDLLLLMVKDGTLNLDDVQEEVDTFMFEGHDTTSSALNWCLQWIGSQPKVQEKLRQEMEEIFDSQERQVTTDDLKSMVYLEMTIKECLRLSPPVPVIGRSLSEDLQIGGKTIPAGVEIFLWPYMIHRDPDFWIEPEKFDPDRFSSENSAGRHPFAYVPFSAGPRNCIGQRFAMMMLKTILCWILRRFEIKSCRNMDEIPENVDLVMRPGGGIELELENCLNREQF